jgi:hypothetical protein
MHAFEVRLTQQPVHRACRSQIRRERKLGSRPYPVHGGAPKAEAAPNRGGVLQPGCPEIRFSKPKCGVRSTTTALPRTILDSCLVFVLKPASQRHSHRYICHLLDASFSLYPLRRAQVTRKRPHQTQFIASKPPTWPFDLHFEYHTFTSTRPNDTRRLLGSQ